MSFRVLRDLDYKWQATVNLYLRDRRLYMSDLPTPKLGSQYCIGFGVRPHRLLVIGDVLIVESRNGDRRQPMYGITGRGYRLRGCYISHEVISYQKGGREFVVPGVVRIIEHPSELTGFPPDHSDVRRFAVGLMHKVSAGRVGAGSPVFSCS